MKTPPPHKAFSPEKLEVFEILEWSLNTYLNCDYDWPESHLMDNGIRLRVSLSDSSIERCQHQPWRHQRPGGGCSVLTLACGDACSTPASCVCLFWSCSGLGGSILELHMKHREHVQLNVWLAALLSQLVSLSKEQFLSFHRIDSKVLAVRRYINEPLVGVRVGVVGGCSIFYWRRTVWLRLLCINWHRPCKV